MKFILSLGMLICFITADTVIEKYPNGKTRIAISSRQGHPVHVWYFKNGAVHKKISFKNGRKDGVHLEYDYSGNQLIKGFYREGLKHGTETVYYPGGKVRSTVKYVNGRRVGSKQVNYRDGSLLRTVNYTNGLIEGSWKQYYKNGTLWISRLYRGGKQTGGEIVYYPDGKRREYSYYKDGKKNGVYKKYYTSGKVFESRHYTAGQPTGIDYGYFTNGDIMWESYTHSNQWKVKQNFYMNGRLRSYFNYTNEGITELHMLYYPEGQLFYNNNWISNITYNIAYWPSGIRRMELYGVWPYPEARVFHASGAVQGAVRLNYGDLGSLIGSFTRFYTRHGEVISNKVMTNICMGLNGYLSFTITNGMVDGLVTRYHTWPEDYTVEVVTFKQGKRHGVGRAYDLMGEWYRDFYYKDDHLSGHLTEYYRKDYVAREQYYQYGTLHGVDKVYYETGEIKSQTAYKYGYKNGIELTFNEDGSVLSENVFADGKYLY